MAWDVIVKDKAGGSTVPKQGAVVSSRGAMKNSRYISILLGPETAAAGRLEGAVHRVHLLLGRDDDEGKIAMQLDVSQGKFDAKRQKNGSYRITVAKQASTMRLDFNMSMATIEDVKLVPMRQGGPPMMVLDVPQAFL